MNKVSDEYRPGILFALRVLTRAKQVMVPGPGYTALTQVCGTEQLGQNAVGKTLLDADTFYMEVTQPRAEG